MRIAIFEFDYHSFLLVTFSKLFRESGHHLTIFTSKKIHNRIKNEVVNFSPEFRVKQEESLTLFFDKNLSYINSHDLLFFNTIASDYRTFYKANFTSPSILRVHNAHTDLRPFQSIHLPKNGNELYKFCSHFFRKIIASFEFYYSLKLINKINFICLSSAYTENYVIENNMIDSDKIFPYLPLAISDYMTKDIDITKKTLTLVIPGSIDRRRRNYKLVLSALKTALPFLKNPIKIYLLGKPREKSDRQIISAFNEIVCEKLTVYSFEKFVSQEKFDSIISDADLIIAPLLIEHQFKIYKEIYGTSKSSGSIYDMITYGRLTIFPSSFRTDNEMKKFIDSYDSVDELTTLLTNYCNHRTFLAKRSQELRNFLKENYSSQKILRDFETNYRKKILKITGIIH